MRKNAETFNQSLGESSENFADIFARLRPLGKSPSEIQTVYQGFNAVLLWRAERQRKLRLQRFCS